MKIKRYFFSFHQWIKAQNFVNRFIIELWSKCSGERVFGAFKPRHYSTSFHVLNCLTALFEMCHFHWINTTTKPDFYKLSWYARVRNEGATGATFGLLMSQWTLLKRILSSMMKNEWLVFDIVGKTNKGEVCFDQENIWTLGKFNQQQCFGLGISA